MANLSTKRTKDTTNVITANRLTDGVVVFLGEMGWTADLQGAVALPDAEMLELYMDIAKNSIARQEVVAVYEFAVEVRDNVIVPVSARELIRAGHTMLITDPNNKDYNVSIYQ